MNTHTWPWGSSRAGAAPAESKWSETAEARARAAALHSCEDRHPRRLYQHPWSRSGM